MADPICRWRNSSVKQVIEFNILLPLCPMPTTNGRALVEKRWNLFGGKNFFSTPYQLAAQMGLYYEDNTMLYPRFNKLININEAFEYINFWGKKYYAPNPYTPSIPQQKPVILNDFLVNWALQQPRPLFSVALTQMFSVPIGNTDILINMLNNFSDVFIDNDIVTLKNPSNATIRDPYLDIQYCNDKKMFYEYFGGPVTDSINHIMNAVMKEYPLQQIFYGAPGTGKSFSIGEDFSLTKNNTFRTTFHPDTDYASFVGCYKPTMKDSLNKPKPIISINDLAIALQNYYNDSQLGNIGGIQKFVYDYIDYLNGNIMKANTNQLIQLAGISTTYKGELDKYIKFCRLLPNNPNEKIVYEFNPQVFIDAYLEAWRRYATPIVNNSSVSAITSLTPGAGTTGSKSDFDYKPEGAILDPNEILELTAVDNAAYPLIGFDNLGDLHDQITVIVKDKPDDEQKIERKVDVEKLKKELEDFKKMPPSEAKDKLYGRIQAIQALLNEAEANNGYVKETLLGLYDPLQKTVYLFKDNIGNNIGLLCAVYVHEMFHAYFHSITGFTSSNYIQEIEEPIAEYSALKFLEKYNISFHKSYLSNVRNKKYSSFSYYAFGEELFNEGSDWTHLYYNAYNTINRYRSDVMGYIGIFDPVYPFGDEAMAVTRLRGILTTVSTGTATSSGDSDAVYLIIEEINRGNCAQIFGDIFQLLDRNDYGFSEYEIKPDKDIEKYIRDKGGLNVSGITNKKGDDISDEINNGKLLKLPNNLYIIATMNTSDQSLFPMDSAFKRRWDWVYVPINSEEEHWAIEVNGTLYSWTSFLDIINDKIIEKTDSEDKQLGFYFCKANELLNSTDKKRSVITVDKFVSKVLFYLYNDVFKDYGFDDPIFMDGNDKLTFRKYYIAKDIINEKRVDKFLKNLEVDIFEKEEESEELIQEDSQEKASGVTAQNQSKFWTGFNNARVNNPTFASLYNARKPAGRFNMDCTFSKKIYHPTMHVVFSQNIIRCGIWIGNEEGKDELFNKFKAHEAEINALVGETMFFDDSKPQAYSIMASKDIDLSDENNWPSAYEWMMNIAVKMNDVKERFDN